MLILYVIVIQTKVEYSRFFKKSLQGGYWPYTIKYHTNTIINL